MDSKNELMFSYGTLQLEKVQLETYGRKLAGTKEALIGYKLSELEIDDQEVVSKSSLRFHPIAFKTNNKDDSIEGHIYEMTQREVEETDKYEVKDYARVLEKFQSGKKAWVYVARNYL